jgi:hypothetical protein
MSVTRKFLPVAFNPIWPGSPYEMWAKSLTNRYYQRISRVCPSKEDVLAECAVVFVECKNKYGDKLAKQFPRAYNDRSKVFMTIFQRAAQCRLIDIERKAVRRPDIVYAEELPETSYEADLTNLLLGASKDLQTVLNTIANAPKDFMRLLLSDKLLCRNPTYDAGISRGWRRCCRLAPGHDLVKELRVLLDA